MAKDVKGQKFPDCFKDTEKWLWKFNYIVSWEETNLPYIFHTYVVVILRHHAEKESIIYIMYLDHYHIKVDLGAAFTIGETIKFKLLGVRIMDSR